MYIGIANTIIGIKIIACHNTVKAAPIATKSNLTKIKPTNKAIAQDRIILIRFISFHSFSKNVNTLNVNIINKFYFAFSFNLFIRASAGG